MRAAVLDLGPLVARAHGDDGRARGNARTDARGRVLEDDTLLRVEPELLGSEQEGVGGGLAGLETLVVCGDGDFWWGDADAGHAAVGYERKEHNEHQVQKEVGKGGSTHHMSLHQRWRPRSGPQGSTRSSS